MNINSGKSKKCPLCKKNIYLTNGRYACETCGYIINETSGATLNENSTTGYSTNTSSTQNSQNTYGTGYNPYDTNTSKTTYTTNTINTTYNTRATNTSSKKSHNIAKAVIIGVFVVSFFVPMVLTHVVSCVAFKQFSDVYEDEEDIKVNVDDYEYDYEIDTDIEIESIDDDWYNDWYDDWYESEESKAKQVLPYSELYRAFATEVFGKPYDTVTPEEYASITYLHQYYYEDKIEYAINDGEIQVYTHDGTMYDYHDKDIRVFTGLKVLNLERESFYLEDSLDGLTELTEVWLGNTVKELSEMIDNPEKVEILGLCDSYDMTSLEGLEKFSNVTKLYIAGSYLEDLSGLSALTKLKELTIENGNSISNFTDLAKITYLEKLVISSNKLKNLSILENMTGLKELSLTNTYITDISKLSKYKDTLTKLELMDNYDLDDFSAISQLNNLETLSVELGYYSEVPDFSGMSKLTTLYMYGAQDITNLGKATNLTDLTLESCNMDNMSVLANLTKVKIFKLKRPNSFIEEFEGIPSMTAIETLDLSSVYLYANVEEIFSLPNLKTLLMNDSRICLDLSKLPENKTLQVLNLNNSTLEKMTIVPMEYYDYVDYEAIDLNENMNMFAKFPNIQELYVSNLGIESTEVFGQLKSLRMLDISNNSISELKSLAGLENLEKIWCGGNTIIDSDSLSENVEVIFEENY